MSVSLVQEICIALWSSVDGPHRLNPIRSIPGLLSGLSVASVPLPDAQEAFCSSQTSFGTGNPVGGSVHFGVSCSNSFSRVLLPPQ